MGVGGVDNSTRDNTTAEMADRIMTSNNIDANDIDNLWKRFLYVNYILINNERGGETITVQNFNSMLEHYKTT